MAKMAPSRDPFIGDGADLAVFTRLLGSGWMYLDYSEMGKPTNITGGKTFQTYEFHMKTHGVFTIKHVDWPENITGARLLGMCYDVYVFFAN